MTDDLRDKREKMRADTKAQAESILRLAGIPTSAVWQLANDYWPDHPSYDDVRRPWWLFLTPIGLVQMGWRKNVLAISWDTCEVRGIVTTDEVTKGDTFVHAWSVENAVTYLRELYRLALALPRRPDDRVVAALRAVAEAAKDHRSEPARRAPSVHDLTAVRLDAALASLGTFEEKPNDRG